MHEVVPPLLTSTSDVLLYLPVLYPPVLHDVPFSQVDTLRLPLVVNTGSFSCPVKRLFSRPKIDQKKRFGSAKHQTPPSLPPVGRYHSASSQPPSTTLQDAAVQADQEEAAAELRGVELETSPRTTFPVKPCFFRRTRSFRQVNSGSMTRNTKISVNASERTCVATTMSRLTRGWFTSPRTRTSRAK